MRKQKILIIEDDMELAEAIAKKFENAGFEATVITTGLEGAQLIESEEPDMILLDLALPDVDGIDILRHLRQRSDIPIIIVSGRTEEAERVVGLELGADDYVAKPFSLNELVARVRVVLRRARGRVVATNLVGTEETPAPAQEAETLSAEGIEMNVPARRVWIEGNPVSLTPTEFLLLQALLENAGKVLSHEELLQTTWGPETDDTHLVEVHMANLRAKIEDEPKNPQRIQTVRGFGYRLG